MRCQQDVFQDINYGLRVLAISTHSCFVSVLELGLADTTSINSHPKQS